MHILLFVLFLAADAPADSVMVAGDSLSMAVPDSLKNTKPDVSRNSQQANYMGDSLVYVWENKVLWLLGRANFNTPEVRATADTIKYEKDKDILTMWGSPMLWVGKQEISGKKMKYNLETEEGLVLDGSTKIDKGWFDGHIIRKVGPNVLNVDYGKFTTCSNKPPHYYFWARELKVYVDDMVYLKPLVFFIGKLPVFAAPFWWFPIKKGRQSGWLHPKVGSSSDKGRYVEDISYYWVTNKYSDLTATLNYFEIQGLQTLLEGRWIFSQASAGNFNGSYIKERPDTAGGKGNERWNFKSMHSQKFSNRMSLMMDANFVSDTRYESEYGESTLVKLDKILTSYLALNKTWDLGTTNFVLQEVKDLRTDSLQRTLPRLSYSLNSIRFPIGYFSYSGGITNSRTTNTDYIQQWDNSASLRFPFKIPVSILRYITISPATSHTYTVKRPDPVLKPYHSQYSIGLGTNIYGKSLFKPEFRQISSPSITYSLVDTVRTCSFGLRNEFQMMLGEKKYTLANVNLASSWNFGLNKINPIGIACYSRAIPLVDLQMDATYKPYEDTANFKVDRLAATSQFIKKTFSLVTTYNLCNYSSEVNQSIWGTLTIQLTQNWKATASRRYDITNKKLTGENYSIYRDLHCWDAVFNFEKLGEQWRYDFKIRLKALPEIKVEKHYQTE